MNRNKLVVDTAKNFCQFKFERYMRATSVYWVMFFIHMAACVVTWVTNIPSFPLTFITLLITLICFAAMLITRRMWSLSLRKLFKPEHFNENGEHETAEK